LRKNKAPPEHPDNFIFAGRSPHRQTLEKLLELIEYIVMISNQNISFKQTTIERLWVLFMVQPNVESVDSTVFLNFLNKKRFKLSPARGQNEYGRTEKKEVNLFSSEEQKYLFTHILCNPEKMKFSEMVAA